MLPMLNLLLYGIRIVIINIFSLPKGTTEFGTGYIIIILIREKHV